MTGRTRLAWTLALAGALVTGGTLATAGPLAAQGGGMPMGRGMMQDTTGAMSAMQGCPMMGAMMRGPAALLMWRDTLGLSADQVRRLTALRSTQRQQLRQAMDGMMAVQRQLAAATRGTQLDERAARAALTRMGALHTEMALAMLRTPSQARAVLTAPQQQRLDSLAAGMGGMMGGGMMRNGMMRNGTMGGGMMGGGMMGMSGMMGADSTGGRGMGMGGMMGMMQMMSLCPMMGGMGGMGGMPGMPAMPDSMPAMPDSTGGGK